MNGADLKDIVKNMPKPKQWNGVTNIGDNKLGDLVAQDIIFNLKCETKHELTFMNNILCPTKEDCQDFSNFLIEAFKTGNSGKYHFPLNKDWCDLGPSIIEIKNDRLYVYFHDYGISYDEARIVIDDSIFELLCELLICMEDDVNNNN